MYPDFLNSLPVQWKLLPVSEVCTFTAKPRALNLDEFPELAFVPMDLIPTGRLTFSNYILKRPTEISSGTYFEEGDLLVSKITPCFENGKQGIAQAIPNGFGIATTEVIPLKPRAGLIHLPFIAYYLLHHEVRHQLAAAMEGATGRRRLSKDLLAEWPVPIPPPDEQRVIAHLLAMIQSAIEVEAAICDKLVALKSATMAKLFREGLRGEPLKQTEIGEIPESWEVVRIGDHCTRMNYGTSQRCTTQLASYPVLRIPNIIHGTIETTDLKYAQPGDLTEKEIEKLRLEPGDLLFVRTNGNREYTGRCAVYEGCPEGALFASYLIRVRLSGDVLVPHFVQQFLSEVGREQIAGRANPAADGKFNIDTSILRSLAIPRPPNRSLKNARTRHLGNVLCVFTPVETP